MVISYRVSTGIGTVIPTFTPFNMSVFKISILITRGSKIFPPFSPSYEYYPRVSMGADFFDIPNCGPFGGPLLWTIRLINIIHKRFKLIFTNIIKGLFFIWILKILYTWIWDFGVNYENMGIEKKSSLTIF